jgi:fused signal recognition particle receptor
MINKIVNFIKKLFKVKNNAVVQSQIKSTLNTGFVRSKKIDIQKFEKLEESLLEADLSYDIVSEVISNIKNDKSDIKNDVKNSLLKIIDKSSVDLIEKYKSKLGSNKSCGVKKPFIVLFFGINGSGKTTTIAKLANLFAKQFNNEQSQIEGIKIMLAACDTFRTAATEQLITLADRVRLANSNLVIEVESQTKHGEDPSAVCYRAAKKSFDENFDILIVDTSGRLNTNEGLMAELGKIQRTIKKFDQSSPDVNIMVIDGSNGSSAISQIEDFSKFVAIDGLILTKMDSSSKAGAIFTIVKKYKQKVFFLSNGESLENIEPFEENKFVNNLFD